MHYLRRNDKLRLLSFESVLLSLTVDLVLRLMPFAGVFFGQAARFRLGYFGETLLHFLHERLNPVRGGLVSLVWHYLPYNEYTAHSG